MRKDISHFNHPFLSTAIRYAEACKQGLRSPIADACSRSVVMASALSGLSGWRPEPAWRRRRSDSSRARFPALFQLLPIFRYGNTSIRGFCADARPRGTSYKVEWPPESVRMLEASFARWTPRARSFRVAAHGPKSVDPSGAGRSDPDIFALR